jgi:hypothetical protein
MGINWSLDLFGEKKKKNGLGKSVYLHFGIKRPFVYVVEVVFKTERKS